MTRYDPDRCQWHHGDLRCDFTKGHSSPHSYEYTPGWQTWGRQNVELVVDPNRIERDNTTGIYVRAIFDGAYGSYDIACLNLVSLFAWLHSRGQQNVLAENSLAIVLGHAGPFETPHRLVKL